MDPHMDCAQGAYSSELRQQKLLAGLEGEG